MTFLLSTISSANHWSASSFWLFPTNEKSKPMTLG